MDEYAPNAPKEFKDFLEKKQKGNKEFYDFYAGNPDVSVASPLYQSIRRTKRGGKAKEKRGEARRLAADEVASGKGGPLQADQGALEIGWNLDPRSYHPSDQPKRRALRRG